MAGFLNLNKPLGITAHDCVSRVRKLLRQKQVGHSGTLDPAASGVLPIAVGQATRLLRFLPEGKAYLAKVRFGVVTNSDDLEGEILKQQPCANLSLAEIEKEILRLAGKARDNKLSIPEMTGGTFTITNGGVFGSLMSTPIINAPQSAILGMHNIVERPIALNGQVVIKPMMYVALSYDHRTIDGRESVSFLVRVKQLLEDPARMLLGI